ncbi:MAG TPA: NAD(P)H-dependent oxidoreductase [Bacteroidia bacterium]|jgi:NAD(P)H-dependent FMN reductase|nr:NAD(P)H-dependent oxidoreductase [Bacteroidia bacterium]
MNIVIISASVRTGRNSNRVATFFKNYIEANNIASTEILDLQQYQFPIFDERLKFQKNPSPTTIEFAQKIKSTDGVIIVTPEYNGGYPASLKNVVDLLIDEWKKKPIAISTVSAGAFGGTQVITSLQFSLWKMQAWVVPAMFPVPKVSESFNDQGIPTDKEGTEKRVKSFLDELLWAIEAKKRMTS